MASKGSIRDAVRAANISVVEKMQSPELYLTDVALAKECIPSIANRKVILASGPPTEWSKRHEIQKGAIIGQVLFEKWADSPQAARKLLDDQTIKVESCNEHDAVGPLTGTFLFIKNYFICLKIFLANNSLRNYIAQLPCICSRE